MPDNNSRQNPEHHFEPIEIPGFDGSPDTKVEISRGTSIENSPQERGAINTAFENAAAQKLRRPTEPDASVPVSASAAKTQLLVGIEHILEDDLRETYERMDPMARRRFKVEGEKTAKAIEALLSSGKIKASKIFDLILNWLKNIPGVNKLFLRQEAKIKTDHILNLKK